ncbi:MAG: sigma-54-dependent Fis family transcriptional regulator [Opitutaceae bacterium]|nr:sigma-54-dependent Fis family transcriptional regulator [Opitutaceae bacterium]
MRILIVDDQRTVRLTTAQAVKAEGHEADTADSGRVALLKLQEERFDLVLLDLHLDGSADGLDYVAKLQKVTPGLGVVIFTAQASIDTAVEAMRRGALDYLEKPFTPEQLRTVLARVDRAQRLRQRAEGLADQVARTAPPADFAPAEPAMQAVVEVIERAAGTKATVLILGENGTGKTQLARHAHEHSAVADGPFVTVSCPSLSRELLESELFGHVAGAFTGAVKDKWGKVEAARGGTLFLDEIGELPAELQPKLLRLLQERTYERVGDTKTRHSDARVIAATNRDLAAAVKAGAFREDLFYRLNVITVTVPPLRERPADLERLAQSFLKFFAEDAGRAATGFSPGAWAAIRAHPWPGNLRELRNAIERAVILSRGDQIELGDLPAELGVTRTATVELGALVSLDTLEQEHVRRVIARTVKLEDAAGVLGIDIATLYRKRKRWAAAAAPPAAAVEETSP